MTPPGGGGGGFPLKGGDLPPEPSHALPPPPRGRTAIMEDYPQRSRGREPQFDARG
jgi:hypothetical protein